MDGNRQPFLTANEVGALSIRRGSLSEKERREIESHVTHTFRFLSQIPWTGEYRRVPEIAYAHHEKLDGTGYPRQAEAGRDPDPVADDDHLRHLRRAGGLGPAVQEVGAGGEGAGHPGRGGARREARPAACSTCSSTPRSTSRPSPARAPRWPPASPAGFISPAPPRCARRRGLAVTSFGAAAHHRPPRRLRPPPREHAGRLRLRPRAGRRARGVRRPAHPRRRGRRDPRRHAWTAPPTAAARQRA